MNRFYVPPLPEVAPPAPEPDPLLEKFRQDTIKGKKIKAKPRKPMDSGADLPFIDSALPDIDPVGDCGDWGIDFDCGNW